LESQPLVVASAPIRAAATIAAALAVAALGAALLALLVRATPVALVVETQLVVAVAAR
jgi:hypothetical protein